MIQTKVLISIALLVCILVPAQGIPAGTPYGYFVISDSSGYPGGTENGLAIPPIAALLPAGSEPGPVQENRDSNNPMSLTLTASAIPLVNEETTLDCEVSSAVDAPETVVTINLPPGAELVSGTLQGTWDIRNDTKVKLSAVVKFTNPGDYQIIATASARPEVDHTWGASNALYLTIGFDKSGYTPPPVYIELAERVSASPAAVTPVESIPKISIAALNANVSGITPRSIDENGNPSPAYSPASTITLHGFWSYYAKMEDGKLSDYRDTENSVMPIQSALVNVIDLDTGQNLGEGYTDANGEYRITIQNPYPHRVMVIVHTYEKYSTQNYELRVVSKGTTLTGLTDVWSLGTIVSPPNSSGTLELGTNIPYSGSPSLHAIWLFQDLVRAQELLSVNLGSSTIKWSPTQTPADGAWYNPGGQIFLGGLEYTSADTSLHEIAHNYMWNYKGDWTNDCPSPHYFNSPEPVRCAYTEGWASFFALAANGNPVFTWASGSNIDLETPTWESPNWANGDVVEGRVVGALWDMMDNANDGTDVYTWMFSYIDYVMRANSGWSFSSFWSTWKSFGYSQNAAFSLYQNTIDYGLPSVPAPVITWISPDAAPAGDQDLTIVVYGTGFYPTSRVLLNGNGIPTTYQYPTRLIATIPATDRSLDGIYPVTVFTPAPGGGTSNSIPFKVNGTIQVLSPNGGERWAAGTTRTITWNQTGFSGTNVKIDLLLYTGHFFIPPRTIAASVPAEAGAYSWTIPSDIDPDTTYWVRITSLSDPSVLDNSDDYMTILPPPTLTVTSPNGGEKWATTTTHTITWDQSGLTRTFVKIELLYVSGPFIFPRGTIAASVPATGSYDWTIPADIDPGTTYRVRITSLSYPTIVDSGGDYLAITPPPTLEVTSPNGRERWMAGTNHNITWNQAGLEGTNVKIELWNHELSENPVRMINASVPATPGLYVWTIPANVTPATTYKVKITSTSYPSVNDSTNAFFSVLAFPILPLPGYTSLPTDPDNDGIYEDLNGNGRLDFADVVLYFNQMEWIALNEPVIAFDLNGNSRIDFADIVKLFGEI